MPEIFKNSVTRRAGDVTSDTGASIAANATSITALTSTAGVEVGDLVDNQHFLNGTKVTVVNANDVTVDTASLNTATATNQAVSLLGVTTAFTATEKSILIGGTFTNNTRNQVQLSVELLDSSAGVSAQLVGRVPVPSGSSFVLSDAGKTVIEVNDEIRVYCNTADAIDVSLAILEGVN